MTWLRVWSVDFTQLHRSKPSYPILKKYNSSHGHDTLPAGYRCHRMAYHFNTRIL